MLLLLLLSCDRAPTSSSEPPPAEQEAPADTTEGAPSPENLASVTSVTAEGAPGEWTFAVTLFSPDTGCERYADWWEVLSPEGELKYRRILEHSHPDEQPFTRTGGPVPVAADEEVIVRAHMSPGGYGGAAMRGTAAGGFAAAPDVAASFAADAAKLEPLPTGCAF